MNKFFWIVGILIVIVVALGVGVEPAAEPVEPHNPPTDFNQVVVQIKDPAWQEKAKDLVIKEGPPLGLTIVTMVAGKWAWGKFGPKGKVAPLTAERVLTSARDAEGALALLKRFNISLEGEPRATFQKTVGEKGYLAGVQHLLKYSSAGAEDVAKFLVASGNVDDAVKVLSEKNFFDAYGKKYAWDQQQIGKWLAKTVDELHAEYSILARALRGEKLAEAETSILGRWGVKFEEGFWDDAPQIILTTERFEALSGIMTDFEGKTVGLMMKRPANYKGGGTLVIPLTEVRGVGQVAAAAGSKSTLWTGEGMPAVTQLDGNSWIIRVPANGVATDASALASLGAPMRVRANSPFPDNPGAKTFVRSGTGSVEPLVIDVQKLDAFTGSDFAKNIAEARSRGVTVKVQFINADDASSFQAHQMNRIMQALGGE